MVSTLDSGSRGLSSRPGQVIVLCSWAKYFTLTAHLSTQEMGGGELSALWNVEGGGGNLAMNWHFIHRRVAPSRGGGRGGEEDGQLARIYSLASKADLLNEKTTIIV